MSLTVRCPTCSTQFDVPDHKVGTQARCPDCDEAFTVQEPKAPPRDEGPPPRRRRQRRRDDDDGRDRSPRGRSASAAIDPQASAKVVVGIVVLLFVILIGYAVWEEFGKDGSGSPNNAPGQNPPPSGNGQPEPPERISTAPVPEAHSPPKTLPHLEEADPAVLTPRPADPALGGARGSVYLSDLSEFAVTAGPPFWAFAKNGDLGNSTRPGWKVKIDRRTPSKSLSMHPPGQGAMRACYSLGGQARRLSGSVGISEDEYQFGTNPIRFVVQGDGKMLWRSGSVRAYRTVEAFDIDLTGVKMLELRTYVENGNPTGCHAVWIDPKLVVE